MTIAFPVCGWSISDAGPAIGAPESPDRMIEEVMTSATESQANLLFRFTLVDPTITGATGDVRNGRAFVYGNPTLGGGASTSLVSNVTINRYMFLIDATASGASSATLASQLHIPGFYSSTFPYTTSWYSDVQSHAAAPVNSALDWTTILYPDDLDDGYDSSYFKDYVFALESVTSFDWTEYLATFTGGVTESYWSATTGSFNTGWTTNGTLTLTSTSTVGHAGAYYSLEKRTIRVYYRKDPLTGTFSIDTRLTFSQPDSKGAIPYPDPNEPAQHVDFSSSIYNGGLFMGKSYQDGQPIDRSGRSIIQGVATCVSVSSPKTRIARAVSLFCMGRASSYGYDTGELTVELAIPDNSVRSLSTLLSDAKRWKYRWPVLEDEEEVDYGEPAAADQLSLDPGTLESPGAVYTWMLPGTAVTGGSELFALYPVDLHPKQLTSPIDPIWFYFVGLAYMASSDVPSGLKFPAKMPHSWDITRDPVSVDGTIYERVRWDPSYSGQAP